MPPSTAAPPPADDRDPLRAALLAWYARHQRPLPWRLDPSPWRVWVSEIMCQQTRVASVIGYFERFMARFPDPEALAAVDLETLYPFWAGLGYYARARNLHAAARQVVTEYGGEIPSDPEQFGALKGVGRYTRGAVMSIAFGHRVPVVDGNVVRVLCRWFNVADDPKTPGVQRWLWATAGALADGPQPGDLNQALMELGATVCTPRSPSCLVCPLASACQGRRAGDPERLPTKTPRKGPRAVARSVALSRTAEGHIWLVRNPDAGLLGGQWALPGAEGEGPAPLAALGLTVADGPPLGQVTHTFTHQRWALTVYAATGRPQVEGAAEIAAHPEAALDGLALGGPTLKALRKVGVAVAARRGAGRT